MLRFLTSTHHIRMFVVVGYKPLQCYYFLLQVIGRDATNNRYGIKMISSFSGTLIFSKFLYAWIQLTRKQLANSKNRALYFVL